MLPEWDVFFCHSTRLDANTFTDRLIAAAYSNLTAKGRRVFWDRKCPVQESTLVSGLRDHIDHSRVAVLFLSRFFSVSTWVELELDHIARRRAGGRLHVLCVRTVRGAPAPRWTAREHTMDLPPETPIQEAASLLCRRLERLLGSGR